VGVVVDPVEHLADRLLGQHGQGLPQGGLEQVAPQPTLRPVDDGPPCGPTGGVQQRGTDCGQAEQDDQRRGRLLGQAPGDHGAAGLADRCHRGGGQRPPGARRAHARQRHIARRRRRRAVERRRRSGAVEEGHVLDDATGGDLCRRPSFRWSGGAEQPSHRGGVEVLQQLRRVAVDRHGAGLLQLPLADAAAHQADALHACSGSGSYVVDRVTQHHGVLGLDPPGPPERPPRCRERLALSHVAAVDDRDDDVVAADLLRKSSMSSGAPLVQ
jgi:hypothetical protein